MSDPELVAARARATAARADLQAVIRELQARLRPSSLASDAMGGIRRKSEEVAEDAVDAVRARPVAASAVAAGIGALIGARLFRRKKEQGDQS
jgi:ElaB/YqjD/DUF883 family membrane-anchored ribosome-binding protein